MISRLGKGGLPPQPRPTAPSILRKRLPRSLGWEAWLAPATLPKSFLNTLQVPLSKPGTEEVPTQYRSDLLGNAAGASYPS